MYLNMVSSSFIDKMLILMSLLKNLLQVVALAYAGMVKSDYNT